MKRLLALIIAACLAVPVIVLAGNKRTPPPELVGTWSDSAEVFGPFKAEPYPSRHPDDTQEVIITIAPDGSVTGRAGNAVMHNARFMKNRGWLGRKLKIKTDYIVYGGTLQGKVTPRDRGTDSRFTMPFNIVNGKLSARIMLIPKFPLTRRLMLEKKELPNQPLEPTGVPPAAQR